MPTTPIAAVLHELLKAETFTDLVDVLEALKCRCASLKIPYDAGAVTEAIQLVERTRPVVAPGIKALKHVEHLERLDDDVKPISRAEAADLWPRLVAALTRERKRA